MKLLLEIIGIKQRNDQKRYAIAFGRFLLIFSFFFGIHLPSQAQMPAIAEEYEAQSILATNALEQMRRCAPYLPIPIIQTHIHHIQQGNQEYLRGGYYDMPRATTAIASQGDAWACIKMSSQGYPILPISALRRTVGTSGASADGLKKWRQGLLVDLSQTGHAKGLIVTQKKSAWHVEYRIPNNQRLKFEYEARELPVGKYNTSDYVHVLNERSIQSVWVAAWSEGTVKFKNVFDPQSLRLPLVAGFIPIASEVEMTTSHVVNQVWRVQTTQNQVDVPELRLESDQLATYRTGMRNVTGTWYIDSNTLKIRLSNNHYYTLAFDPRYRHLDGVIRRIDRENEMIPAHIRTQIPTNDDFDGDTRVKSPRFYRAGDWEYEKQVLASQGQAQREQSQSVLALQANIEMKRQEILKEPSSSAMINQSNTKVISERPQLWRVCSDSQVAQLLGTFFGTLNPHELMRRVSEICYAWTGDRQEWKETILRFGCNGRCKGF